MIGVYIIGGFVTLLLLAIYGAINRLTRELKAMFIAILASKKSPWEEMVKRFEQSLDEKEEG
jgi:hypothetical protein